ncbi:MAG: YesL family protein [Ruminiclostridium sp.]|nr:YesL family protein [Ruminiclostridium sp.]
MAFGLYNYRKTGSGVEKGKPKKKSFFLFWEIFGAKFWKFFQINLIYVLCCIPIVTFGPATAAMTQLMRKFVIGEPIFVWHEFKTAFKKNWKQGLFMGSIDIILLVLMVFDLNFYVGAIENGSDLSAKLLPAISLAVGFIVLMMHFYIYPQIVALDLRLPQIIKNSFILMIVGFKRSFAGFFAWVLIVTLIVLGYPYTMLVLPFLPFAWLNFIATFCAYPVIQKHIIDPYYESRGERNPEYTRYESSEEALFEDKGGSEAPTEIPKEKRNARSGGSVKVKAKGKVIR